ncbi:MAG: GYD domain-containing protein [Candidatus Acidiferrales bacterium]
MAQYLHQISYTLEAWKTLVAKPQNRIEAIRPAIEKLGGKLVAGWFSFGDYDIIAITDFPDPVSAAAIAIAFAAGGACRSVKTTQLLSAAEGIEALKRAGTAGYKSIAAGH